MNRNSFFILTALCLCIFYTKAQTVNDKYDVKNVEYEVFTPTDSATQELLNEVVARFHYCLCAQEDIPLYGAIFDREDEIAFSLRQGPYPTENDGFCRRIVEKDGFVFFFEYSSDYYHFQQYGKQIRTASTEKQNAAITYVPSSTWITNRDYMTLVYKYIDGRWMEYAVHHCVYSKDEISSAQIGQLSLVSKTLSINSPYVTSEATGGAVLYVTLDKGHRLSVSKVTDMIYLWVHDSVAKKDAYYFDDDYCTREDPQYQYYYSAISQILYSAKCKVKRHPNMDGSTNVTISNKAFRKQLSHREPLYIEFKVSPISK